ncbi:unnamed protein product [Triticum turgidum subsp. durum]|uniref:Uncharacterized protein n=1 Tax=Triticum turgidum subsp. durum TaxID=4567 RepID=A0A9R0UZN9_TRITD|nr:unnamed protein product [Triticum turgidum subsp. durum]
MDGYGIPASGPRPPQRFDDASSESEEEEGIGFPAGGGVAESESDEEDQNQRNGKAPAISSRCSVKKLHDLLASLEMDFRGLLELPKITKTDRHFLMSILGHIDEEASSITIDHKRDVQFYDEDVHTVLGIPCGAAPVRDAGHHVSEEVLTLIRGMFGIGPGEHSILPIVEAVKMTYGRRMTVGEKNKFKVGLVICACTYLLAPTLENDYFCTDYWGALATPDLIHMHKWCRYTREELLVAAKRVKADLLGGRQKSNLSGCLPFIQVFYVDNLDAAENNIDHTVWPRVKVYTYTLMKTIIQKDVKSRKGDYPVVYGRLLPRAETEVCYHRNPMNRKIAAGTSTGTAHGRPVASGCSSIDIKEFTSRCEEVLLSTARKKEEENHRHFNALNSLENSAQHTIKREAKRVRDGFFSFFSIIERQDAEMRTRRNDTSNNGNSTGGRGASPITHSPGPAASNAAATPPDTRRDLRNSNISPEVVEVSPRRFKKTAKKPKKVRFECEASDVMDITDSEDNTNVVSSTVAPINSATTPGGCRIQGNSPSINLALDSLITEAERYSAGGKQNGESSAATNKSIMDIVPGLSTSDVVGAADVASTYPVCCAQDPNYHHNRLWNYPDGHPLLEETASFDLGVITPPCNKSKGPSLVSIAAMRDVTRRDLFGAGDFGTSTPGSANLGTPSTPFHIASASLDGTQQRQIVHDISPVSCTRSVATGILDFREEVEADCVNLNKPVEENSLSAPPPKRRVVPGPAGRSPFIMQYRLSERASGNATHLYLVFSQMSGAVLNNNWVVSPYPSYIELTGAILKKQLSVGGFIEIDLMNVFMRRFQQLENVWARKYGDSTWRHYPEPDFVSHVLRGGDFIRNDYVRNIFVGHHISHDVNRCPMMILPVQHTHAWSTYFFDFPRRRTTILDPMINNGDRPADELRNEHIKIAHELRAALMVCIAEYFDGWAPKTKGWQNWFPKLTTGPWVCSRASSGIVALHYARQWMGTKLQRTLSPIGDEFDQSRMMLLYEVLGLGGNIGQLPAKFKVCQTDC